MAIPMNNAIVMYMLYTLTHLSEHSSSLVLANSSVVLGNSLVDQVQEVALAAVLHHDVHSLCSPELLEHTSL